MDLALRILVLIAGIAGGVVLIKYSYPLTQFFGHSELAERYLGSGGTYTMWKLLGLLAIFLTIWYVF